MKKGCPSVLTGPDALTTPSVPSTLSNASASGRTTLLLGSTQVFLKRSWYCALTVRAIPKKAKSRRMTSSGLGIWKGFSRTDNTKDAHGLETRAQQKRLRKSSSLETRSCVFARLRKTRTDGGKKLRSRFAPPRAAPLLKADPPVCYQALPRTRLERTLDSSKLVSQLLIGARERQGSVTERTGANESKFGAVACRGRRIRLLTTVRSAAV